MDRSHGYDFLMGLCSAIEQSLADAEGRDPAALQVRGNSLRFALERELYVQLVNDDGLYVAYADGAAGSVPARDAVEADVLARLLANAKRVQIDAAAPSARDRIAATAPIRAALTAQRRRLGPPPGLDGVPRGAVLFLIDHPKFVPFVAPVVDALRETPAAAVSIAPPANALLAQAGLPSVDASGPQFLYPPDRRNVGSVLVQRDHLVAAYERFVRILGELRPSCLVVIEGNAATDELFSRAGRELGIPTVCLQQGWAPVVHTGFRNMSYDRMAVWGEGFAELLQPFNPEQRFAVTGSHILDARRPSSPAHDLREGRRAVGFFLQPPTFLISESDELALLEMAADVARANADAVVFVREHPGTPAAPDALAKVTALPNVELVPAPDFALRDVIDASDVVVSIYSTTLIEAAARQRPVVIYNPTSLPRYVPDLEAEGAGVETRDAAEARDTVNRMLADAAWRDSFGPGLARIRERFFGRATGDGPERVAALIGELG